MAKKTTTECLTDESGIEIHVTFENETSFLLNIELLKLEVVIAGTSIDILTQMSEAQKAAIIQQIVDQELY